MKPKGRRRGDLTYWSSRRVGLRKRAYDNHIAAIKVELGASNLVQLGVFLAREKDDGDGYWNEATADPRVRPARSGDLRPTGRPPRPGWQPGRS